MNLSFNRAFSYWLKSKRNRPVLTWTLSILWLLLLSYLAFFWNLGSTGLVDETEPLFAEAARQMTVTGDWITPFFDGKTRFDKPILIYWLMAIAYEVLGVNSWAVRLPSALSAMGLVSLGFYTLRSFGGGNPAQFPSRPSSGNLVPRYWISAGLGSALMALHPQTIVWARTGVSDMLLTACMGGALLSFFLGYAQPTKPMVQMRWYLAFYVLVALAVLTKGPVGIVLPGLIISSFLLYTGNVYPVWQEMRPLWGTLLMILIAVPWYVLVIQANGWAYIDSFFGHHNFARFTTVLEHNSEPWYFYLLVVLLGFAPWSVYLPVALARLKFWRRNIWRSTQRSNHLGLFALFWFVSVLGFFTLARTKLPSYMLPLMPAAAILVTLMWSEQLTQGNACESSGTADKGTREPRPNRLDSRAQAQISGGGGKREGKQPLLLWSGWLNVMFLLVVAAVMFYSPHLPISDPAVLNFRQKVEQSGLPVLAGSILAIAAVAVSVSVWYRQWWGVLSANLVGFVAFLIFAFMPVGFLIDQVRQLPLRELSAITVQAQQPGERLIMIGFKKPSVVFYTQRPVDYFLSPKTAVKRIKEMALTQPQPSTVLVLSQPKKWQEMGLQPSEYQNLGESGTYQLIRVSKMVVLQK